MNKNVRLSLFYKFFIAIILIVIIFGIMNIVIVRNSVYNTLDSETEKRSIVISKSLAEQALPYILSGNIVELNNLINNVRGIDPSIYYIFILNDRREVLAHSFDKAVPTELISANIIEPGKTSKTILLQDYSDGSDIIKDYAILVLDERIGVVRLGILETHIKSTVKSTVDKLLFMIILFLVAGVISAFTFSYLIAKPIKVLSTHSDIINIKNIPEIIRQINSFRSMRFFKFRKLLYTEDEIDILYDKFLLMLKRIEENHNELTTIQMSMIHSEKMASIGTLSAGIAHEINNPIAGLKNCLRRMNEAPADVAQNIRYVSLMTEALEKMQHVVHRLLDFSRKETVNLKNTNLKECINNVLFLIKYKIDILKIDISLDYQENKSVIVANKNQIEQVILNLVLNSIESIEEKKLYDKSFTGKIAFTIITTTEAVILEIADNGLGVTAEDLNSIFNPFFSARKIKQGTGLGLAVCHNIISLHKSKIEAFNNQNEGLTIRITFPENTLNQLA